MQPFHRILSAIIVAMGVSITIPAMAETPQEISTLTKKAETGDAEAQNELGKWYLQKNTAEDAQKAKYWFEKAMAQGSAKATHNLGMIYYFGEIGIAKDFPKAITLLEQAATQGLPQAQTLLSMIYIEGLGVKQDNARAQMWFDKAKAQKQSITSGFIEEFFNLAKEAQKGNDKAQLDLAMFYLSPYEISSEEFQYKGKQWLEKSAMQGNALAQYLLGSLYDRGDSGVKPDSAQARYWYEKSAVKGNAKAQLRLGLLYILGQGGKQDLVKGEKWLKKSCDTGYNQGCETYQEFIHSKR